MDWTFLWFFAACLAGVLVMCGFLITWIMKKAGIKPLDYHRKLTFDNCTFVRDTRMTAGHRSYYRSKKGGSLSVEMSRARGTMLLEFYTEDGQVLRTWRNGDPAVFSMELPPRERVYWRADMNHFTGSIIFR